MSRQSNLYLKSHLAEFFHHYPVKNKKLLVAVSGGADSVCLLHALASTVNSEIRIFAAHLDHQLRGQAALDDAQYVFDLCHKFLIPVVIGQEDAEKYRQQHKMTLEEAAREVRYRFLAKAARAVGAGAVAIAHTQDDNTETILMNLLRGSGTRGLAGLKPVSCRTIDHKKLVIIRPLLEITRADTTGYCRLHRLQPRCDATNLSLKPTRNRVRLELLPLLRQFNTGIDAALLRTARIAADDIQYIETLARKQWPKIIRQEKHRLVLNRDDLIKLPPALQRNLLFTAISKIAGTPKDIESRHIEDMIALLPKPTGKYITLPYGIVFGRDYGEMTLRHDTGIPLVATDPSGGHLIKIPGETVIPGWQITTAYTRTPDTAARGDYAVCVDAAAAGNNLVVRTIDPGDRFRPLGMKGTKKISEFLLDAKVPVKKRITVPVVVNDRHPVWVVGHRIDDRVKITPSTTQGLVIEFRATD